MPDVSRPLDGVPFHVMSHDIYKLHQKGTGTPHANVRLVRDVLSKLATSNYENGYRDGHRTGIAAQLAVQQAQAQARPTAPPLEAEPVPQVPDMDPNTAFDIRDLQGQSVVLVTHQGHVLLRGAVILDPAKLVFELAQLGRQMGQYQRDQAAIQAA